MLQYGSTVVCHSSSVLARPWTAPVASLARVAKEDVVFTGHESPTNNSYSCTFFSHLNQHLQVLMLFLIETLGGSSFSRFGRRSFVPLIHAASISIHAPLLCHTVRRTRPIYYTKKPFIVALLTISVFVESMSKNITIEAPAPAVEALKALVALLQLEPRVDWVEGSSSSTECRLVSEQVHPLDEAQTKKTTVLGWSSTVQHLCEHTVLWDATRSLHVQEWIQVAAAALVNEDGASLFLFCESKRTMTCILHLFLTTPYIHSNCHVTDSSIPDLKMSPQDLCDKIEGHLLERTDETYLVGDFATAADVCVAIWLSQQRQDAIVLPDQCKAWMTSILVHPTIQRVIVTAPSATTTPLSSSTAERSNAILQQLDAWNIDYAVYDHVRCMTADELVANVPLPQHHSNDVAESHTKNLFLRDKKHGLFLVTTKPTTNVSTKTLGTGLLGLTGKVNLRMAEQDVLEECLKAQPGCVGPLSMVNDQDHKVTLVLDRALLELDKIHSHPLDNTKSVVLTPSALQEYLNKAGATVVVVDFTDSTNASSNAAAQGSNSKGKASAVAAPKKAKENKKQTKKGETLLALQWKKNENFAMWYSDVIVLSEMISYYDISGCYILRPWSYKIWELIQHWFNMEVRVLLLL